MINALGQNAKITDPKQMQQALEAIAYQGQAGSFEAADMAKWFPELLANMASNGITGLDAVTQLGAMLQVQMKQAGSSDEAANNLKNWMGKIGSTDTVRAYEKAGIDYKGSMQTGLQNGMSTLETSMALAQKYIQATDPKRAAAMAEATSKISKEANPEKAKAMMASLEESLRTGDLFADMQVKAALSAYMQNKALYSQLKNDSRDATGILDKNLAERRESSSQKWAEMAQSMDDAMRSIGNLFVDGVNFSGDVPSLTLPKLTTKTDEYRGGGMAGPIEMDYRVVQNHLEEFVRQFKWALSSRQVFEWQKMTRPETLTDIQRAARFFYLQHHAFAGKVSGQTFGTATTAPAINLLRIEENLSAAWQRLSGTYVENLSWLECAERYDRAHTFHYMDPPYWQTAGYGVDFPFDNHERMADFMRRCKGKVMVSINDHPDIRRVFEGFHFETLDIRYSNTNLRQGKAEVSGELVIMNWTPESLGGLF